MTDKQGLLSTKDHFLQTPPPIKEAIAFVRSLTTMCAGEGERASLRACLLWRVPAWTSSSGHFICRYWSANKANMENEFRKELPTSYMDQKLKSLKACK